MDADGAHEGPKMQLPFTHRLLSRPFSRLG
jgi:hypothetical protein